MSLGYTARDASKKSMWDQLVINMIIFPSHIAFKVIENLLNS